jgi:NAD(P)H dehydrogenase (quinone)
MNTTKPIAVLGATGAQGAPVAHALLDAGRPVRAIARTEAKLEALAARGAETVALDLADADALTHALTGVGGAFTHLPFVPVMPLIEAWATALGQALVAAQVPITVHTASGPVPRAATGVASFDTKAAADRILKAVQAPIVFLEPTGYLANLSAPFSAPSVVAAGELRYPLPAEHRQAWISVEDQAAVVLAALQRPDLAGRSLRIGVQLTGPELAEGIATARGLTVRYVPIDPAEFGRALAPMMGAEIGDAVAADYALLAGRAPMLGLDADTGASHAELGVEPTPVADWARAVDWEAAAAIVAAP